jgi:hypothetical protein
MLTGWDNIQILQVIDQRQQRIGGGALEGVNGCMLMDEIARGQVMDDRLWRGFLQEIEILADEGYLTLTVYDRSEHTRRSYPYQYLEQIRNFALTVAGQDRARGIVVRQPLPNPDEDDNRPISALLLRQIAHAIAEEYSPEQILVFLDESGIPLNRLPLPDGTPDVRGDPGGFVCGVLFGLDEWGSEGRRVLRLFVGSWLDDRLISSPTDDLRTVLLERFARQGWYVQEGNLVIGEPARDRRTSNPVLGGARPDGLQPKMADVAVEEQESQAASDSYVSAAVIANLEAAAGRSDWDCGKLLRLIGELNDSVGSENAYSAHAMLRAILDHIPPILGQADFRAVVSNCSWGRTDQRYLKRLQEFRDQADDVLHRQISKSPSLIDIHDMPARAAINVLVQACADKL